MSRTTKRPGIAVALAALCFAAGPCGLARAGDPGELFPSVAPYDQTVSSPVSRPEEAIRPHPPAETVVTPREEPKEEPNVAPKVQPTEEPKEQPKELPPEETTPGPESTTPNPPAAREADLRFHPYSEDLTKPFLDEGDQKAFEQRYAGEIGKALAGSLEDRRAMVATLRAAAESTRSNNLRRYLLLHALGMSIRAVAPVAERAALANKVLPLLTDRNLAIAQSRVDCLTDLMLSVSASPSARLYGMNAEAYASLAKLQVQAGFPRDAQQTLKKAREAAKMVHEPSQSRSNQLAEASAWVERATMAAGLWPRWQQTLKSNPSDAFTNTQCALLHLALYGQLAPAAVFAEKSGREELTGFAAAYKAYALTASSQEDATQGEKALAVCEALLEVAKAVAVHPFDRYSIAYLAGEKAAALADSGVLPAEKAPVAKRVAGEARDFIGRGTIHPGGTAKWMGGSAGAGSASGGDGGRGVPAAQP